MYYALCGIFQIFIIAVKNSTGTQNIHDSFLLKYSIIQYGHNWTVYVNYSKCCILFCILYLQNTKLVVCVCVCVCVWERERERDYVTAITEENYF